jgi:hypothetical protein
VEHLRTVHFTLVVVSLALVVLLTSDHKSTVSKARDELKDIGGVINNWDVNWMAAEANNHLTDPKLPSAKLPDDPGKELIEVTTPDGRKVVLRLHYDGPNWTVNTRDDELHNTGLPLPPCPRELTYAPGSVFEFRQFWDDLAKPLAFKVPFKLDDAPRAFIADLTLSSSLPEEAHFVSGKKPSGEVHLKLASPADSLWASWAHGYTKGFYISERALSPDNWITTSSAGLPSNEYIVVAVNEYEAFDFDPQRKLNLPPAVWRHRPFSDAFPNLSNVTQKYEKLRFDEIDNILETEESRAGDSFEAIGIKFPAEGVTRWGLLLILGIQLYLFLHLHELTPKLKPTDEGWEVAWIGVYKSHLARVLYFASSVLLPATAAFALAWHMPDQTRTAWWLRLAAMILGTTLSLLLGSLAWRKLRKNSG